MRTLKVALALLRHYRMACSIIVKGMDTLNVECIMIYSKPSKTRDTTLYVTLAATLRFRRGRVGRCMHLSVCFLARSGK